MLLKFKYFTRSHLFFLPVNELLRLSGHVQQLKLTIDLPKIHNYAVFVILHFHTTCPHLVRLIKPRARPSRSERGAVKQ